MKKILLLSTVIFLIAACASKSPTPDPTSIFEVEKRVVQVPVLYCPEPPKLSRPTLAIESLSKDSNQAEILRSYGQSLDQTIDYSKSLERVINGYKGLDKRSEIKTTPQVTKTVIQSDSIKE